MLEVRKKVLENEHPDTLLSMANLAWTYKSQGYDDKAMLQMKKCYQLQIKVLGSHHPYTEAYLESLITWSMEE